MTANDTSTAAAVVLRCLGCGEPLDPDSGRLYFHRAACVVRWCEQHDEQEELEP